MAEMWDEAAISLQARKTVRDHVGISTNGGKQTFAAGEYRSGIGWKADTFGL